MLRQLFLHGVVALKDFLLTVRTANLGMQVFAQAKSDTVSIETMFLTEQLGSAMLDERIGYGDSLGSHIVQTVVVQKF